MGKMKKNLLYILATVALLVSCTDEQVNEISPFNGQDVKFSASLSSNNNSRTLYGDEAADAGSIRVNWVHGDNITVYGTTCNVKQANYTVDTGESAGMNYALNLNKTGAAGVQWGNEASDFYAVYPAVEGAFSTNVDGTITVSTQVAQNQKNKFTLVEDTWVGTPYVDDLENPSMSNALMYAYTADAKSSDNNGIVNLTFKPFSTVLKFKLNGWEVHNDMTGEVGSDAVVTVNKITIKAPVPVVGECDFTFVDGIPTVSGGEYNDIVIYPNQLLLEQGQSVEFNAFAIPQEYTMTSSEPWTVIVETDYGTYNYKIAPSTDATLAEGQIHKINIPNIQINQGAVDLESSEWMKWIPRNVYLSELSLPGAWYATNSDYQSTTDLSEQYAAGIRAFNIDCRMTASADSWTKNSLIITYYTLNDNPKYLLQCAGSETLTGQKIGGIERVSNVADGLTVESQLELLSSLINDEEYIMVVLTISEKPKDLSGAISDSSETFGNNVNPEIILAEIKDILTRKGKTLKVFGYRDQDSNKTLNANTTVNDVLGSMIIKINVNVDQEATDLSTYNMENVLLCEGSMASEEKYIATPIVAGSFTSMNTAALYWGNKISEPSMYYYYHQAQMTKNDITNASTSTTPSFVDRKAAIDDIINKSSAIYSSNEHNGLFQISVGGRLENDNRTTVAEVLNPYILEKVNAKLENNPSPIGIVLMNYCTDNTYKSEDLTNAIIKMNTKFYLNRDMTQEEWPNGNPYNPGQGEDNGES